MKNKTFLISTLLIILPLLRFLIPAFALAPDSSLSDADSSYMGEAAGDESGSAVALVGDVNGDGYDDILIGSSLNDDSAFNAGKAYLFFGKETGWVRNAPAADADASFLGEVNADAAGYFVSGGKDVNDDEHPDILIGAIGNSEAGARAGQTYVVLSDYAMPPCTVWVDDDWAGHDPNY
jgi:hypothetical protein